MEVGESIQWTLRCPTMRFRECMVALPRFNPLKKPSAFWRKSGGYTKVNTNILKDFVGFFRCHEKPRRFGAVRDWSLNQGDYVSATLGLRANNPMAARLQPYCYEAMTLRLRRRNPGVMKQITVGGYVCSPPTTRVFCCFAYSGETPRFMPHRGHESKRVDFNSARQGIITQMRELQGI